VGGDGVEGGVVLALVVGFVEGLVVAVFEPDGDAEGEESLDGVGVGVARAGGALPTTRTIPAPRTMTSGFRADRASTAHNLPIAPQRRPPRLTPGRRV
jgi:hypothetical protein